MKRFSSQHNRISYHDVVWICGDLRACSKVVRNAASIRIRTGFHRIFEALRGEGGSPKALVVGYAARAIVTRTYRGFAPDEA